jgi:RimJ/RimL family protein N-acetyltransferase
MAFGPEMRIAYHSRGVASEMVLSAIGAKDINDLPSWEVIDQATPYISPYFKENLQSLRLAGAYFEKLRESNDSRNWGIFINGTLIGMTGYDELLCADGPETYSAILDPEMQGKGAGVAAALARNYHAFQVAEFKRIRSSIDMRNNASLGAVKKLGYVCLEHASPYGYERHQLAAYHPEAVLTSGDATRVPLHGGSWQEAQYLTSQALELAETSFAIATI